MNKAMASLQEILYKSENNSIEENIAKQNRQITNLLEHAKNTVPFYKDYNLSTKFNEQPSLSRAQVQLAGDSLTSLNLPESHGLTIPMETSGSTGQCVRVLHTDFVRLFYDALILREHSWHSRDFSQTLMAIRGVKKDLLLKKEWLDQSSWGHPIDNYYKTGKSALINISSPTHRQIAAIQKYTPYYILTFPSQLCTLAEYCLENRISLPSLRELRTTGETLTAEQVLYIKKAWPEVKINDVYSCAEIGNIAQQCPEYQQYHINLEHVHLEIVDEQLKPCPVGVSGRVLVTSLMNYATPLIRYELGDYATFGEKCPCGRGLPVLKNILGRTRNRLFMQNGETRFPYLGEREEVSSITTIRIQKFQFVQHTLNDIEIKVVTPDICTTQQENEVKELYKKILGFNFNFNITYHKEIPVNPNGKFEEFISHVSIS